MTTDIITKAGTVFDNPHFKTDGVNKENIFTGDDLTADTYYFKPGQILDYHKHPEGDQVFFVLQGKGIFYLDNGDEQGINVKEGSIIYIPAGVWCKVEPHDSEMICSQVTKAGAGIKH